MCVKLLKVSHAKPYFQKIPISFIFSAPFTPKRRITSLSLFQTLSLTHTRTARAQSMSMLQPFLSGSTTPSFPFKRTVLVCCAPSQQSHVAVANGPVLDARVPKRTDIRIGLPSKGRMTSDTLDLLKVRIASFLFLFFLSVWFRENCIALNFL